MNSKRLSGKKQALLNAGMNLGWNRNIPEAEKAAQGQTGFVPIATRWVIERSNAWVERCKSLVQRHN